MELWGWEIFLKLIIRGEGAIIRYSRVRQNV